LNLPKNYVLFVPLAKKKDDLRRLVKSASFKLWRTLGYKWSSGNRYYVFGLLPPDG